MSNPRSLIGRKQLQQLAQRRDLPGLIYFATHVLWCLATGTLVYFSLGSWLYWPAAILHGIVVVHWFAPFHECSHNTAFKTRWMNDALYWLTSLIIMLPPTHFRLEHRAHHAHTQDPEKDPEMIPHTRNKWQMIWFAGSVPYFWALLSSLFRHPFGHLTDVEKAFIPHSQRQRVIRDARIMWAVYGGIALISILTQSTAALTFWLIPRILGEPFMRIIRMSEHGARPFVPDMLRNTRTVKTLRPITFLGWNMAYHAEHHCLPAVPFHALPGLHEFLRHHIEDVRDGYIETQIHVFKKAS